MSAEQDLKQLLQQMKRMTDAIEGASASSGSYQVRPGRGGRSNGKVAGENSYDAKAIAEAEKELAKVLLRNSRAADGWDTAIRNATGITSTFGESVRQAITRIDSHNKTQSEATRRVTAEMIELAKANGVQSKTVKDSNTIAFKYSDAMRDLINKHNELAASEKERKELNDQIAKKTAERAAAQGQSAKKKLKKEIEELEKTRDAIKSVADFEAEIDKLQDAMIDAAHLIDHNVNPAFKHLEGNTLAVVTAQKGQRIEADKVKKAFTEVNPLVKAQGNATRQLTADMADLSEGIEKGKQAIVDSLKKVAGGLSDVAKQVVGNFREQLKYNIRESHYLDAIKMGMTDGELSKVLGENTETFRGMTGSTDNAKVLDGTLQKLQQTVLRTYGEAGVAGAQRVAQVAQMTQRSGINIRDNPAVVEQRLKALSDMSDRLGMVKGNLVDFAQQLTESGDMAYLASKYQGMDASGAAAAMDRELEARLANAKMLGQSTEQLKAQIQLQRQNSFGTAEHQIMNMVGAEVDAGIAQQNGVTFSPEIKALQLKERLGINLTADEQRKLDTATRDAQMAMINNQRKAADAGDTSGIIQQGVLRSISGSAGGSMYSVDALSQAQTADAIMNGNYTDAEKAAFRKDGTLPASFKGDTRETNSSLMIGDQMANSVGQALEGVVKTPLWGIAANTLGILLQLMRMNGDFGKLSNLWRGRGSPGGPGGPPGPAGGLFGRAGTAMSGALATSGLARAGGGITNGLGAAASRVGLNGLGGRLANVGTAGRVAAGGLAGAGIGIVGAGIDMWGSSIKEAGKAEGPNDTILDKETLGATMSVAGKAVSYGATGALIGSVIPGVGTAIGAAVGGVIGAGVGLYENADTLVSNINTLTDDISEKSSSTGPAATLEATRTEAEKERAENAKPQQVELIGPAGEAIIITGTNTQKLVDKTTELTDEQRKANDLFKTEADVRAIMESQKASIAATEQRMTTLNFS